MSEQQPAGADLARQALNQARAAARARGQQPVKAKVRRRVRATFGDGRDPVGLGSVLDKLADDFGWRRPSAGARIIVDWPKLVPEIAELAIPERYDADSRTLHVRPVSHTAAAQVRLHAARLVAVVNERSGAETVAAVRVLPPGAPRTTAATAPAPESGSTPAPAGPPVAKTRAEASPGLLDALAIAAQQRGTPPVDPQQELRDRYFAEGRGTLRESPAAFTDAVVLEGDLEASAARDDDPRERALARARAEKAGRAPALPQVLDRTA